MHVISYQTLVYIICITTQTYTHLYSMKTAVGAASQSIYLCNNKGNSVSVTPVSCQIKILVSVCHLPENFCTLSMTRSILTVPFAFLINVSSLILSWLLILPFLARTSGQVLANPDNMAVFCSGRKQLELQKTLQLYVYLQIHQPMADRKREW